MKKEEIKHGWPVDFLRGSRLGRTQVAWLG